jgi:hypothetical protein
VAMALSSLFRRNAELCTKMASAAKSIEVREQWLELGKQWQKKAEADQLMNGGPINTEPLAPFDISPSRERGEPCQDEEFAQSATLVPAVISSRIPPPIAQHLPSPPGAGAS